MGMMDLVGGSESVTDPGFVYGAQDPYLEDLYSRSQLASYNDQGTQFSQGFQQPTMDMWGQMARGGAQIPGLQQGLSGFGQMQNQALGGAIDAGLSQINNNFNRNIMPSINQGAAMSGTSGGSRQGIAQGLAMSDANQQASNFVSQMQSDNWQNQMNNQLSAYGQLGSLQAQQNQSMTGAMGAAPGLSNMGFASQYGNLAGLSGLIGTPTVLSGGSTSTSSDGLLNAIGGLSGYFAK
jgi:hypothetical protein